MDLTRVREIVHEALAQHGQYSVTETLQKYGSVAFTIARNDPFPGPPGLQVGRSAEISTSGVEAFFLELDQRRNRTIDDGASRGQREPGQFVAVGVEGAHQGRQPPPRHWAASD